MSNKSCKSDAKIALRRAKNHHFRLLSALSVPKMTILDYFWDHFGPSGAISDRMVNKKNNSKKSCKVDAQIAWKRAKYHHFGPLSAPKMMISDYFWGHFRPSGAISVRRVPKAAKMKPKLSQKGAKRDRVFVDFRHFFDIDFCIDFWMHFSRMLVHLGNLFWSQIY